MEKREDHKPENTAKHLVIIGGGFAGSYLAKRLENELEVTLIDEKDYFEFTPSVLRALVEPKHLQKIQVLHSDYLKKINPILAKVKTIKEHSVILKNKQEINYDYLAITSGTRYNTPIKDPCLVIASQSCELNKYIKKLSKAKRVLIIGGGIVGVELAAEIAEKYPEKKIQLMHSHSTLINRTPKRSQRYSQQYLVKEGVSIIFNERVEYNNRKYLSTKGKQFPADLVFMCTGVVPNYEHLGYYSSCLNSEKFLQVNEYLQVKGEEKIFAAGDIVALHEEKTAQAAEKQAEIVAKNILHHIYKERLERYEQKTKPMVISLGKNNGIFIYKQFVLTGFIPGLLKRIIEWKTMQRYKARP